MTGFKKFDNYIVVLPWSRDYFLMSHVLLVLLNSECECLVVFTLEVDQWYLTTGANSDFPSFFFLFLANKQC